ncbi:MAG TPA: sensor histidine kinase [Candidatus Dormibacteraeota bacterium]|jgi:signal transduction histidine kinase|nr:sensor histidine kinase [Candidatus Dormibacteraeota bacterium]
MSHLAVDRLRVAARWLTAWPTDVAAAVVLAVLDVIGTPDFGGASGPHPRPVLIAFAVIAIAPLCVRRRWPFWALAVVAVTNLVAAAVGLAASPAKAAALLLILYTVSTRTGRRTSALISAAIAGGTIYVTHATGPINVIADLVLVVTTWALADSVRSRRSLAAALEELARSVDRERAEEARRAATEERARIARELHDVVAHSVSVMTIQAGGARRLVLQDPAEGRSALVSIEQTGRQALAELRRLLTVLRAPAGEGEPADRAPQPGLDRLDELLASFRTAGMEVDARVDDIPRPLPAGVDLSAYRILQEALTNCLKHAPGTHVDVSLTRDNASLLVGVENDGGAIASPELVGAGHGLIGMRQRVDLFGGELAVGPRSGGGWRVRARLPLVPAP